MAQQPPIPLPRRSLNQEEVKAIEDRVIQSLPKGLDQEHFRRLYEPAIDAALAEAEYTNKPPTGGAVDRFISNAWEKANPITAVTGMAHAVMNPRETVGNIMQQAYNQGVQARQSFQSGQPGSTVAGVGHMLAGSIPFVGPQAANVGKQLGEGDYAGAAGGTVGLVGPPLVGEVLMRRSAPNPRQADILARQARQQVADQVLAPGNPRYKGQAAAISERVISDLTGDRAQLQQAAFEGMQEAVQRIDAAATRVGPIPVPEVIAGIQKAIDELVDSNGIPFSDAAARRVQLLRQRITEMRARGGRSGVISLDDLKGVRDENYRIADEAGGYQKQGNPVMSDEGYASLETGTAIKDVIARRSPETAAANADYTFFKTLNDVLDPVKGRPKSSALPSGVTGGTRVAGALAGTMMNSKAAAFVFSSVLPKIREYLAGPEWKLIDAQRKMRLSEAMRSGDLGRIKSAFIALTAGTPVGNAPRQPEGSRLSIQGLEVR